MSFTVWQWTTGASRWYFEEEKSVFHVSEICFWHIFAKKSIFIGTDSNVQVWNDHSVFVVCSTGIYLGGLYFGQCRPVAKCLSYPRIVSSSPFSPCWLVWSFATFTNCRSSHPQQVTLWRMPIPQSPLCIVSQLQWAFVWAVFCWSPRTTLHCSLRWNYRCVSRLSGLHSSTTRYWHHLLLMSIVISVPFHSVPQVDGQLAQLPQSVLSDQSDDQRCEAVWWVCPNVQLPDHCANTNDVHSINLLVLHWCLLFGHLFRLSRTRLCSVRHWKAPGQSKVRFYWWGWSMVWSVWIYFPQDKIYHFHRTKVTNSQWSFSLSASH